MMSIAERHKFIKEQLSKNGFVRVQDIADQLCVTGATIRKDLRILESQNVLYRTHGSASPVKPQVIDRSVKEKITTNVEQKKKIAEEAKKLITDNDAILLASGSTVTALAEILEPVGNLTVVTPSLGIAVLLNEKDNISVSILGGALVKNSLSVRDTYSVEGLKYISCSKLFIGVDGITFDTGFTCATIEEARLTHNMMKSASKTIVLADSSKFGMRGFGKIGNIEDIDILITDPGIPKPLQKQIEDAGVQIIIAE